MTERTISFKVDPDFYRKVKVRIAQDDKTLKDYIIGLIEKDLKAQK